MKYDVLKDIDMFEKEYGGSLNALLDSITNEKYKLIIDRNGVSYVNKATKIVHIDPTGRLVYLTVKSLYLHIFDHPSWQLFNHNDIGETMFFFAKSNLLHEVLHILHTDSNAASAYMLRYTNEIEKKIFHSVHNCIEDGYIESKYGNDLIEKGTQLLSEVRTLHLYSLYFPNLFFYQKNADIKLNSTRPFQMDKNNQNVEINRILRQVHHYLDRILFFATDTSDDVRNADYFELNDFGGMDEVFSLIDDYFIAENITERFDICDQILEIMKEDIPNFELLYQLDSYDLSNLSLCSNDQIHYDSADDKGMDFNEIEVIINDGKNFNNDTSEVGVKHLSFNKKSKNFFKFEDNRDYTKKTNNNEIKIELDYQRALSKTFSLSYDKKYPVLKDFKIIEQKMRYSLTEEVMCEKVLKNNIASIKYIENLLKQILLINKGGVLNKQYFGNMLDNHNLADCKNRVFNKKIVTENMDFSVSILIDLSGSIYDEMYRDICDRLVTLGNALQNANISYSIEGFNIVNGETALNKIIFKDFLESSSALASLFVYNHGSHNSFDLLALMSIKDKLRRKNCGKHIILYITDGKSIYVDKSNVAITSLDTNKEIENVRKQLLKNSCTVIPICFEKKVLKEMATIFPDTIYCEPWKISGKKLVERIKKEIWRF